MSLPLKDESDGPNHFLVLSSLSSISNRSFSESSPSSEQEHSDHLTPPPCAQPRNMSSEQPRALSALDDDSSIQSGEPATVFNDIEIIHNNSRKQKRRFAVAESLHPGVLSCGPGSKPNNSLKQRRRLRASLRVVSTATSSNASSVPATKLCPTLVMSPEDTPQLIMHAVPSPHVILDDGPTQRRKLAGDAAMKRRRLALSSESSSKSFPSAIVEHIPIAGPSSSSYIVPVTLSSGEPEDTMLLSPRLPPSPQEIAPENDDDSRRGTPRGDFGGVEISQNLSRLVAFFDDPARCLLYKSYAHFLVTCQIASIDI
ncbi:hypothetical protein VNI00_013433 [Paramarasmius palmivorus]|uniref:Uncharacterized protein n=1 Tax=Paramarasmius palmivorus TaxID=297713 RepID=A0AAW0BZ73_9AGAR